jgi:hemolysin III
MGPKPQGTAGRIDPVVRSPSRWEIGVDSAIHAVAIIAGLAGAVALFVIASARGGAADLTVAAIYSGGLIAMFSCSAAYNLGRWSRHRFWLRNLDQAAIFVMIAGTYTPFTILHLDGAWRLALTGFVWSFAAIGIGLRLLGGSLFDRLSTLLYLGFGWMALLAIFPLVNALDPGIVALLAAGGLLYTIGVIFHLRETLPFQNAIWHAFVLAAASVHYAAVAGSLAAPAS